MNYSTFTQKTTWIEEQRKIFQFKERKENNYWVRSKQHHFNIVENSAERMYVGTLTVQTEISDTKFNSIHIQTVYEVGLNEK